MGIHCSEPLGSLLFARFSMKGLLLSKWSFLFESWQSAETCLWIGQGPDSLHKGRRKIVSYSVENENSENSMRKTLFVCLFAEEISTVLEPTVPLSQKLIAGVCPQTQLTEGLEAWEDLHHRHRTGNMVSRGFWLLILPRNQDVKHLPRYLFCVGESQN